MSEIIQLPSLADLYQLFGVSQNLHHPLVGVMDFGRVNPHIGNGTKLSGDFYTLLFKNYSQNNIRYGRKVMDFQGGSLVCMAPGQVIEFDTDEEVIGTIAGWGLFFHPDFIRNTSLYDKMQGYTFFSYEVSEALHLSDKERQILTDGIMNLETELQENIDGHSQAIIVSAIELLLNYCTRFYSRQFITRQSSNHTVVAQVERFLNDYFKTQDISEKGLPKVADLAEKVNLSPGYLSDLLKKETGKNAQEQIHYYLIEQAKHILLSTNKSVAEVAYTLGFEYPQYFNRLFKQKTGMTPVAFRN